MVIGDVHQSWDIQRKQTALKGGDETLEIILQVSCPEEDTFRKELLTGKDQYAKDHISIHGGLHLKVIYSAIQIDIVYSG
jgi:hypothetical protein